VKKPGRTPEKQTIKYAFSDACFDAFLTHLFTVFSVMPLTATFNRSRSRIVKVDRHVTSVTVPSEVQDKVPAEFSSLP